MSKDYLTNAQVSFLAEQKAREITSYLPGPYRVFGVPRGGIPAAYALVNAINKLGPSGNVAHPACYVDDSSQATIIFDDLIDSGATCKHYAGVCPQATFYALINKQQSSRWGWVIFPWEKGIQDTDESITDNVTRMLQYIGEDVKREGLVETPARVVKAWSEWFSGYSQDPKKLFKTFTDGAEKSQGDEMVVVHNIPIYSHCEHHVAAIFGEAHIAYIPNKQILGLSKFNRVVNCFMRRLQVQERLTNQIADAFEEYLKPKGVAVLITARHLCMESRGVHAPANTLTTTSALRGVMLENPSAKMEFMSLVRSAEKR